MLPALPALPRAVRVVEVGPRDGLQNEKVIVPTGQKIQFIQMLADAGLPVVEGTSFVNPRAIPQLSDASEVMAGLTRLSTTSYPVLVPNLKGMERGLTKEVASTTGKPASASICMNCIFCPVGTITFSLCRPSRGPTSTTRTARGRAGSAGNIDHPSLIS